MKASWIFLTVALVCLPLSAASPAPSDTGGRAALFETARSEIGLLERNEADSGSLGEWKDIIGASLFQLFRRTELFRGEMRVLVVENPSVLVRIHPEGTVVLSTALLDYIDASLFEAAAGSPRRMRSLDSGREAMLVPFLVTEASHFALDHPYAAFRRNGDRSAGRDPFLYSAEEMLEADRFSAILLSLAGFDPLLLGTWLTSLDGIYAASPADPAFARYLADIPSPAVRIASLASSDRNLPKITDEFTSVISGLRSGLALNEAEDSLAALAETYPEATWLDRLDALVLHRRWLATVPVPVQRLKTFFPVAAENDPTTPAFLALLAGDQPEFPAARPVTAGGTIQGIGIPGDAKLHASALDAYRRAEEAQPASGLASSRAMLLFWSDETAALRMAETAAAQESGSRDSTARANYASLLYLTGTDYARAQYLLGALPETTRNTSTVMPAPGNRPRFVLDRGITADERDILLNSALILRPLGDVARSAAKRTEFERLYVPSLARGTIPFRQISIADTADTLASKWGKPAEIIYNYVTENWVYPSLSASVLLAVDPESSGTQVVRLIRFGAGSPLTPGNDVRTGDSRSDFESIFGKPAYRAGDFEVYLKDGNRLSVLYLSDTIRSMTAGL